jgi:integrase
MLPKKFGSNALTRLTKRIVDATEPDPRVDIFVWDGELPGFGLRVRPGGTKTYVLQYRTASRQRRMTIGRVGPLTPDEARKAALTLLAHVAQGGDPSGERANERRAITVKALCEKYLADAARGLVIGRKGKAKKLSTLVSDRGRIVRHIQPLLGSRRVTDLTSIDIVRFIRDVSSGKTATVEKTVPHGKAVVRGGAGTAARTVGLLGGILSYAVAEGIIGLNPVHGVKRPADKRRSDRLSADDYFKLGSALEEFAEYNPKAVIVIRLLALTGCRRGEIERLKWSEIDLHGKCLRLADTKEGASIRPLGSVALELLQQLTPSDGVEFVFPGGKGNAPYVGLPKVWTRVAERAGLAKVTPHTLRHSFASVANDLGFTEPTIAAILGHAAGSVTGRYVHHLDAALIAAADRVSRSIYKMMNGETADVVSFPAAASFKSAEV